MRVFISHSSKDYQICTEICEFLERKELNCWIATRDIVGGAKNWGEAIVNGIETSNLFLLILSENANSSDDVARELQIASSKRKTIVTVCIEDVELSSSLQYFLVNTLSVDISGKTGSNRFNEIYQLIQQWHSSIAIDETSGADRFKKNNKLSQATIKFGEYSKLFKESLLLFESNFRLNMRYYCFALFPLILLEFLFKVVNLKHNGTEKSSAMYGFIPQVQNELIASLVVLLSYTISTTIAQTGPAINAMVTINGRTCSIEQIWNAIKTLGSRIFFTNLIAIFFVKMGNWFGFYVLGTVIGVYASLYILLIVSDKANIFRSFLLSFQMIRNNFVFFILLVWPIGLLHEVIQFVLTLMYEDGVKLVEPLIISSCFYMLYSAFMVSQLAIIYKRLR